MARDDWFRNSDWNGAIEASFFEKLKRARDKAQYLRIQACVLAEKHPRVALRLLDQYFSLGNHVDEAQANVDRASAHLSLARVEDAIESYEAALAVEDRQPFVKTSAYILLPFVVATHHLRSRYEQALKMLDQHRARLTFPVEHFQWHAARALISADQGNAEDARTQARHALEKAASTHSGFRNHAAVGLVGDRWELLRQQLEGIATSAELIP